MQSPDPTPAADDQAEATAPPLPEEIKALIYATAPPSLAEGEQREKLLADQASAIVHLLAERGHYLPGCPPASQILKDAQQFAGQLMLAMLVIRLLRLLGTKIVTPETKPTERWLTDYIEGRNHGPVGKPMFWPAGLPGLAGMLREWGYAPTATHPPFVSRAIQPMTIQ